MGLLIEGVPIKRRVDSDVEVERLLSRVEEIPGCEKLRGVESGMQRFRDEGEGGVVGPWDSCYALEGYVVWEVRDQWLWWIGGGFVSH